MFRPVQMLRWSGVARTVGVRKRAALNWAELENTDVLRFDPTRKFALPLDPETSARATQALRRMYVEEFTAAERRRFGEKLRAFGAGELSATRLHALLQEARGALRKKHADEAAALLAECCRVGNLSEILSDSPGSAAAEPDLNADLTVVSRICQSRVDAFARPAVLLEQPAGGEGAVALSEFAASIDGERAVLISGTSDAETLRRSLGEACGPVARVEAIGNFHVVEFETAEAARKATSLAARLFGILVDRKFPPVQPRMAGSFRGVRVERLPWRAPVADVAEQFRAIFSGERRECRVSSSRGVLPDHSGVVEFRFGDFRSAISAYTRLVHADVVVGEKPPALSLVT